MAFNSQRRVHLKSTKGNGNSFSLSFLKVLFVCFCIIVISDIVLLLDINKEHIDLEDFVHDGGKDFVAQNAVIHVEDAVQDNVHLTFDLTTRSNIKVANSHKQEENIESGSGSAYLTMYGDHRVKLSLAALPKWLQDYFAWHRSETSTKSKEADTKYLVVSCVGNDKCGGISDRMRALPFYLLLASKLDRVLCIYWSRPFGLDSFLQPLPSGIDWRCPADFYPLVDKEKSSKLQEKYKHYTAFPSMRKLTAVQASEETITVISNSADRFYSIGFSNNDFDKINRSNLVVHAYSYEQTMPLANAWMHIPLIEHIFKTMFEPIEPIAKSINATMTSLGLVENEYTSVHVRARYPSHGLKNILGDMRKATQHDKGDADIKFEGKYKNYLTNLGKNALECGMMLKPSNKIFFSSDSIDLTRHFIGKPVKLGKEETEYKPLGIDSREEIRHLDQRGKKKIDHVEFYPLIEDLLIMGGSQCVAHGIGSFGSFGAGLAGDRCRAIHRSPVNGGPEKCPNGREHPGVANITDEDLMFEDKVLELGEGRLPPAKPFNMLELEFHASDKGNIVSME